ncbi:hypothetical protein JCM10212_005084 [Sporobolomyces blumeae]
MTGASGTHGAKPRKRAGKGKGRMMMIKVFYSLQSPRFGSTSTPSAPPPPPTPRPAPSPDFFAVLDPALASTSSAPSPQPPPSAFEPNPSTQYSCIARLSAPVWVQVLGAKKGSNGDDDRTQYGRITLKTCLSAICISRPELVIDATKDFSVSAVDPYESSGPPPGSSTSSSNASSSSSQRPSEGGQGLVEGKGMLSWTLAEKKEGTTMVCGRIVGSETDSRRSKRRKGDEGSAVGIEDDEGSDDGDEPDETLEVWLQLNERDAFTQVQFLDCLRSYHNPVQHLQSEMSDFASSPPKQPNRRESAPFAPSSSSSSAWPRSTSSGPPPAGDPVKRRRPSERQSLPLSASTTALPVAPASAFAKLPVPDARLSHPHATPATSVEPSGAAPAQNPALLALLSQLVSASAGDAVQPTAAPNQEMLVALAQLCGLPVPTPIQAPAPTQLPAPTSTSGPVLEPSARPSKSISANDATTATTNESTGRRKNAKPREHFAAIETSSSAATGKQNPRNPKGCSNCNRKKSTLWREGLGPDGKQTSVCNACGTFYNKNGYHRSKGGPEAQAANSTSGRITPPGQTASIFPPNGGSSTSSKPGRPLTGRLTAVCEADLAKRKPKKKTSTGSFESSRTVQSGMIVPVSPGKHVGPRSPSLNFGFTSSGRSGGTRASGIMSSPGRSPRLRYRHSASATGTAATSPLRAPATDFGPGSTSQDGGFDFAALFGGIASPSPKKRTVSGNAEGSGGKGMPSYLLTASPGTALDRILNDTNIGSSFGFNDPMSIDRSTGSAAQAGGSQGDGANAFNFFLQPGSPTLEKENERPRGAPGPNDPPTTDLDSFESVLSSLRRDFSTRLSSNTLTAPSSPVPSSPCVQPRTSTATPGSKGKAPLSSGRPAPSIFDSFTDSLVPGVVNNAGTGTTPQSDSDAWSPLNPQDQDDQTISLDSILHGSTAAKRSEQAANDEPNSDFSQLLLPNKINANRRAAFLPSHVVAPSDATDFDLNSLPPSSPPQLLSEAFPTPSDFDGITPGTDGGDLDERDRTHGSAHEHDDSDRLTIEAVAEKLASEPNDDARNMIMSLLRSVGTNEDGNGNEHAVELPGLDGGDKITLDRATVDRLLALVSSKANASTPLPTGPSPSAEPDRSQVATSAPTASDPKQVESPDLSQIDFFKAFEPSQPHPTLDHTEQMNGLYSDLFSAGPF